MAVTLVASRHWSARNLSDRDMALWASFVIEPDKISCVSDDASGQCEIHSMTMEGGVMKTPALCR
jgi:L-ascorbate metabolism protein UlaG (beta-lactamase superfamily)